MSKKFSKAVMPSMPSGSPSMNMAGAMGIPRRKMKSFKIDEISFVDKPAQEGALATIEKAAKNPSATRASGPRVGRTSSGGLGRGLTGLRGRANNPRMQVRREQVVQASAGKQLVNHIRQLQTQHGINFNSPRRRIAQAIVDHANAGATPPHWQDLTANYYGFNDHSHAQAVNSGQTSPSPEPGAHPVDVGLVGRLQAAVGSDDLGKLGKYNQNHDNSGRFSSGSGGGSVSVNVAGMKPPKFRGGSVGNPYKVGDHVRVKARPELRGRVVSLNPESMNAKPGDVEVRWHRVPREAPWASTALVHHSGLERAPSLIGRLMGKAEDSHVRKFNTGASAEDIARYNEDAQRGDRFHDHIRTFEQQQGVNNSSPPEKISEAIVRSTGSMGEDPRNFRDMIARHYGFRDFNHAHDHNMDNQNTALISRLQGTVGANKRALDKIIKMVLIHGKDEFLKGASDGLGVGRAPPLVSALDLSLRSILADPNLGNGDRLEMMRKSTLDFVKVAVGELPRLEGYVRKSADPDVERSADAMNLRQLKKKLDVVNVKLDAVLSKRREDEDLDGDEFGKGFDDYEGDDGDSLFKASYKNGNPSDEEDTGAIAQRLNAMFGHSAVKARRKHTMPPDMGGGGMDDIRAEINQENANQLDPSQQADMGADDPDPDDYGMGKKMKTGPRRGEVTTEGEEEDKIAAGSAEPIGGQSTAKRTRLHESMVIGERVIHKSDVGPDMFEILKAQKEETDRIAKALDDERDTRELLEFAKVAETELPHLPGTAESKARLLKNLSGYLDDDERRLLTSMLKSGDRSAGTAFKTYGQKAEKSRSAIDFQKRVSIIKSRDGCSNTEAMKKARDEHPDEFEAFQYGQ